MLLPNVLNLQIPRPFTFSPTSSLKLPFLQTLKSPAQLHGHSTSSNSLSAHQSYDFEEEHVVGDCVVFEDGIFEDLYLQTEANPKNLPSNKPTRYKFNEIEPENLVPDQWRDVQAELNITKKDRRKIAQELEFGRRVEKRREGYLPLRSFRLDEVKAYKEAKLAQLKPVVLDNPTSFPIKVDEGEKGENLSERVTPKDPRWAVYGRGLDDVTKFFNSGNYDPGQMNFEETPFVKLGTGSDPVPGGPRKLFTKEEKVLLNRKIPDLSVATSDKWLPVHTLAASGEFYFLDALLKHAEINGVDKDGLGALHKAIIGKKHAITNYLLRESANPFARDKDGASLLHYAVQTASSQAIKLLLLYNVDINLQDNDGWTPLHVAVQTRRTDVVRLLLIKGADKTIKNREGLTSLELCLYSGRDSRTYDLIKLLKLLPKPR